MKTYAVKSIFHTIQGEGAHAGTPAVFLRLAGCNMWSGHDEDRERDAERTGAKCPRWCDTDFVGGAKMSAAAIATEIASSHMRGQRLVVVTGGEPLLQVDDELLDTLHELPGAPTVAIETNGTVAPKFDPAAWLGAGSDVIPPLVWLTMSPKLPRAETVLEPAWVSEVKLVWPAYNPVDWSDFLGVEALWLSPQARSHGRNHGNEYELARLMVAGEYPGWRLSLQTHKIVEVP